MNPCQHCNEDFSFKAGVANLLEQLRPAWERVHMNRFQSFQKLNGDWELEGFGIGDHKFYSETTTAARGAEEFQKSINRQASETYDEPYLAYEAKEAG